jgi:hypothetical protein
MAFSGLSIEGNRDAGSCFITYFAIPPGRETLAGRELLALLGDGTEVRLSNDLDEGGEGTTGFRRSASGLDTMVGGHGWQSDWKPIDEATFLALVAELAVHNRGGPVAQGQIIQDTEHDRKRDRLGFCGAAALVALALLVIGYRWLSERHSLRGRFDRVTAGMSEGEVLEVMGPVGDRRSERWPPQVSDYAEVWRLQDGVFVRQVYRGLDVHTKVGLPGQRYSVWKTDEGVVVIGYDADGRVCSKVRFTE